MTLSFLAQINTGVSWADFLINEIFLQYGGMVTLIVVVLVFVVITQYNQSRRADANETFVLDTAKDAKENKDELIRYKDELMHYKDEFYNFRVTAAENAGVFQGRVDELSKLVKHNQDKYEEKERIWTEERRQLKEDLDKLRQESQANKLLIETLQGELNGKSTELQSAIIERDLLQSQVLDAERSKADLELERERMRALILDQENAIKALKAELDLKRLTLDAPPPAPVVTISASVTDVTITQDTMDTKKEEPHND